MTRHWHPANRATQPDPRRDPCAPGYPRNSRFHKIIELNRAQVPDTRPLAEIQVSQRLQHLIHFRNQGSTSRGKPPGVRACEIWCVLGPAATLADARYLATVTASPCLHTHPPADAGKSAHYFLRWVNTRNQPGPWSETVTATIPG